MKIDRLIGIITILLQKERVTIPQLAERFEVSCRTIQRDIDAIGQAGIPIVSRQGYGGGLSIADGYKLDKTVLSEPDKLLFQRSFSNPEYLLQWLLSFGDRVRVIEPPELKANIQEHAKNMLRQDD
ncbi:HTH domain-containing protein [Desulfitobacterium hafniense]|uniref:HTH domain-containing protein n=1 Tax=Desulfitobacterium hafniense TaxID=49338 RepID=UPI000360A92E